MSQTINNPLSKHFRQPKLYIRLPSDGNFYAAGALQMTENREFPVFAMTAKDELMFKTPDALLNGQSTVQVIQSCIPNIKNAWAIPSIDIDAILIAIRIATYGEKMDITVTVPELKEERTFEVDLRVVLDQLINSEYENIIAHEDFLFEISPMSYKRFTDIALKTFEEQRLFRVVNDDSLSESEKLAKFNESFSRLTEINISNIINSVVAVKFGDDDAVTNKEYIKEFFENADRDVYKSILVHIDKQREKFSVKPFKARLGQEDQARGAPETIEVPITFDQSNFFA